MYFSPNGIGLGHASRCAAIAGELKERGVDVRFSTYGRAFKYLDQEMGFPTSDSPPIMWSEGEEGALDYERTMLRSPLIFLNMLRHFKLEYKRVQAFKPDISVSDTRYTMIPATKRGGGKRVFITNQPRVVMPRRNDGKKSPLQGLARAVNYNLLSGQDKVLLPDFPHPHSICHLNMDFEQEIKPKLRDKMEFIGPVTPYGPEDVTPHQIERVREKYGIEGDGLVYIALSGPGKSRTSVKFKVSELVKNMEIEAVMTTGVPAKEPKITRAGSLLLVDGWIQERAEILALSRAIVCRAGLSTLSEVVRFGLPSLVFPTRNQPEQESNAMGVKKLGIGRVFMPVQAGPMDILGKLEEVLDDRGIKQNCAEMEEMAREWDGGKKGAQVLMSMLGAGE